KGDIHYGNNGRIAAKWLPPTSRSSPQIVQRPNLRTHLQHLLDNSPDLETVGIVLRHLLYFSTCVLESHNSSTVPLKPLRLSRRLPIAFIVLRKQPTFLEPPHSTLCRIPKPWVLATILSVTRHLPCAAVPCLSLRCPGLMIVVAFFLP
ncbi:hypothetical protein CORC01_03655, partial [Colletotrichum orchidophilum]